MPVEFACMRYCFLTKCIFYDNVYILKIGIFIIKKLNLFSNVSLIYISAKINRIFTAAYILIILNEQNKILPHFNLFCSFL